MYLWKHHPEWERTSDSLPLAPSTRANVLCAVRSWRDIEESCNADCPNKEANNNWGCPLCPKSLPFPSEDSECLAECPCCWIAEISMHKCTHWSDWANSKLYPRHHQVPSTWSCSSHVEYIILFNPKLVLSLAVSGLLGYQLVTFVCSYAAADTSRVSGPLALVLASDNLTFALK